MSQKSFVKEALEFARNYTEGLIGKFETPTDWVSQSHENANHALWCIGHIACVDNFGISMLAPEKSRVPEGYGDLFGRGSKPTSDVSRYPSAEEVTGYMRERRETLLGILDRMPEEDFEDSTPDDAPDFIATNGQVFRTIIWHEGLHAGQASIASRGLGKEPVLG